MNTETLNLWGNGAVTLPKEWREQFPTRHFLAVSTPEGLLIKPILDVEYYEGKDGSVGLKFPMGVEAGTLAGRFSEAITTMAHEEMKKGKSPKKPRSRGHVHG